MTARRLRPYQPDGDWSPQQAEGLPPPIGGPNCQSEGWSTLSGSVAAHSCSPKAPPRPGRGPQPRVSEALRMFTPAGGCRHRRPANWPPVPSASRNIEMRNDCGPRAHPSPAPPRPDGPRARAAQGGPAEIVSVPGRANGRVGLSQAGPCRSDTGGVTALRHSGWGRTSCTPAPRDMSNRQRRRHGHFWPTLTVKSQASAMSFDLRTLNRYGLICT